MTLELREGQDLSSRYSLLHQIARKDTSEVWLAIDQDNDERVCLKILDGRADALDDCIATIESTRGLIHPNIVRAYDASVHEGHLLFSSAYIKGALPFEIESSSFTNSWSIIEQILTSLEFAHSLGIYHGQLHPGNLLVDTTGGLHITDFALPGALALRDKKYLSPQRLEGQTADSSDDIYSLGCILFHLLTGREWGENETFESNSPIPAIVQHTVSTMLDSSPYARPGNLQELKEILGNYAQGVPDAQPIEIQQTNFSRANSPAPSEQGIGVNTSSEQPQVHRLPREKNQISSTFVFAALAVLLVLAGFVFVILPGIQSKPQTARETARETPLTTNTPAATRVETPQAEVEPEPTELAPLEIAQLEFLKEEGKKIAARLVRQQVELEDVGVLLWAPDSYAEISRVAEAGDTAYREKNYQAAIDSYESAIADLQVLEQTIPEVLQRNLEAGKDAFEREDVDAALTAWTIVSAIEPDNMAYNQQLLRAENFQQLLGYMSTAEFKERESSLEDALTAFQQAAKLDPQWQPAKDAVSRIRLKIAKANFADAMSEGFSALAARRYEDARNAFGRASTIFPDSSEPADGILQIDLAERMDAIEAHRDRASKLTAIEDWAGAIAEYESVVALDPSLTFASSGLQNARKQLELNKQIDRFLEQPTLMQKDEEFAAAKTALIAASKHRKSAPRLKDKLATLSRLISVARIPIPVEITSDNRTDVTVYKIGDFGKIESMSLELIPGKYTIVGKRRGFRNVRHELVLLAGEPVPPISIRCTEKI